VSPAKPASVLFLKQSGHGPRLLSCRRKEVMTLVGMLICSLFLLIIWRAKVRDDLSK
jgi:hypothetical protein